MAVTIDITGQSFGRLVVVREAGRGHRGEAMWLCRCNCGNEVVRRGSFLRRGTTVSCGCAYLATLQSRHPNFIAAARHGRLIHGHAGKGIESPTHRTWRAMKERCDNPNVRGYSYYGGRGITVCERWRASYENFLADMGDRPAGKTLDRVDVNGNYEPSNCRWATAQEQAANKRPRRKL